MEDPLSSSENLTPKQSLGGNPLDKKETFANFGQLSPQYVPDYES